MPLPQFSQCEILPLPRDASVHNFGVNISLLLFRVIFVVVVVQLLDFLLVSDLWKKAEFLLNTAQ